ncbi:YwaF family protein [Tenuibacillus multivorans]|uniref:Conserved hypothetical integral membrane protein TIGR02206 n=1 Tax=Tenuibacillus multivorans TaxID=237069 RepID=A0A1G9WAB0_9BACI|nr:TIGR02206 family membrane protein [Tenuibacillus multivorans]GEL76374.1 hypothetical protein TMU01_06090 [Tenuibacillus multivorans]SDM81494.1 conserved hypothetical integral membrane protein TIGR02206 [Tenuibacillus multivorans]
MINQSWSEEAPFIAPFDIHHLVYIIIVVALLGLLLFNKEKIKSNAHRIGAVILTISILQQIMLYSWYIFETGFNISESLPLHISRISSLLGIYFIMTKNFKVLDVLFFFSIFAYGSFLYPQRIYEITHIMGLSFLINHAITILLPYFAYIAFGWRPTFKSFIRAYVIFVVYLMFVYLLNPLIDGNYFYLKYRPFLDNWSDYLYIPGVLIITFIGFLLFYRVVKLIERARR